MFLIFSASADQNSAQTSSLYLEPFLRWLFPGLSAENFGRLVFGARKLAHVTEYAILAVLCWRAFRGGAPGWKWRHAGWALALVALYAATDEWHQTFVPSRQGTVMDVLIDVSGGVLGLGIARVFTWRGGRPGVK